MEFQENLERSARSDGNAFLIRQMLEFYLSQAGFDSSLAEQMLNYGCYCNLLPNRFQVGIFNISLFYFIFYFFQINQMIGRKTQLTTALLLGLAQLL
jgi:hypothetical protein